MHGFMPSPHSLSWELVSSMVANRRDDNQSMLMLGLQRTPWKRPTSFGVGGRVDGWPSGRSRAISWPGWQCCLWEVLNTNCKEMEGLHKISQWDIFERLILFLFSCPVLDHKGTVLTSDFMYLYDLYILYIQYIMHWSSPSHVCFRDLCIYWTHDRRR